MLSMCYSEPCGKAAGICAQALEEITRLEIPANPLNYTVWYNYFSGENENLVMALDALIEPGSSPDPAQFFEIYQEFIAGDNTEDKVDQIGEELEVQIDQVLRHMNEAGLANSDFCASVSAFEPVLADESVGSNFGSVLKNILVETRAVLAKSRTLERKLEFSTERIGTLQSSIQEIRKDAQTDGLTGLANRTHFDRRLMVEAERAIEDGTSLCLLLCDIDHFKKFNDTYGHSVGDSVLKVVARNLTDNVKGADLAARFGGEEFAIVLPQTGIENAALLADRIRSKLANKNLKSRTTGQHYGHITLSIGAALYRPGELLSELIDRADRGLYKAKQLGRNRVVQEGELETPSSEESAMHAC